MRGRPHAPLLVLRVPDPPRDSGLGASPRPTRRAPVWTQTKGLEALAERGPGTYAAEKQSASNVFLSRRGHLRGDR